MLDLRTSERRAKLPTRREPYWVALQRGCALGYRRGRTGGAWVARWRDLDGRKRYGSLGDADDGDCSGLSYDDAYYRALVTILRAREAALASGQPQPDHKGAIDEAAAQAVIEATRSRRHEPPPIDLAALAKDLTSAKRLYELRLRRWRAPRTVIIDLDGLAAANREHCGRLAALMANAAGWDLLRQAWDAMTACQNKAALADLLGAEAALARIAADMDALHQATQIAHRGAINAPSEEHEICARIEYDLFGRVLPRIYERHFGRRFSITRNAYSASGTRPSGPAVNFVMAAAELIGIRNRVGLPYTSDVIPDAREALKKHSGL